MGFEPTILVFERAKTVHILDRAATVIGAYATAPLNLLYVLVLQMVKSAKFVVHDKA
jgi:hypothetical protein